jgi:triacylglycerol esterase/lipase EstA (alpha/beta hydrolase family)
MRQAFRRGLTAAVSAAALTAGLVAGLAGPASAQAGLPVNYDSATGYLSGFLTPAVPPPGANNFSCTSAAHPYPVVLVNGTFANMDDNWQAAAPLLANHGYCVFTFNYGGSSPTSDIQGTGDIAASAQQLANFVSQVLAATGAARVDLVGHSQGGMMPRYYISFLGGAAKVDKLVALAPSNYGTTLDGLTEFASLLGLSSLINSGLTSVCEACVEQEKGSSFLATLNAVPTVPGVSYTVIEGRAAAWPTRALPARTEDSDVP